MGLTKASPNYSSILKKLLDWLKIQTKYLLQIERGDTIGKILIVEFKENEEDIFQQTVTCLSKKLACFPTSITKQEYDFTIDPFTRTYIDKTGKSLYLTAKEFDLLYFLYSHRGQVFNKEQLYENVWGYDYVPDAKNLSSFIRRLRKKVEPDPNNPQYILTVWGVGYKFAWKEQN